MVLSFFATASGSSRRPIVLPYDFDILRPSRPGTFGVAVSSASGSGRIVRPVPSR